MAFGLSNAMQDSAVSWTATWISSTVCGGPRVTAPAPYFRTTFRLDGPVRSAVLHITALGLYECEINGRRVGDLVFAPGWTDYHKRVYYQSHDVTSLLTTGDNAIGVILGDGWYSGHVATNDRQYYGQRPQLLAQLEITAQNGSVHRIVSDAAWKTTVGPILEGDLLMGETYDAQRELGSWSSAGYDDASWLPATLAPDPAIVIERLPGPPVRRHEILPGRTTDFTAKSNHPIFDFGQNLTGRVRFTVRGKPGTRLSFVTARS